MSMWSVMKKWMKKWMPTDSAETGEVAHSTPYTPRDIPVASRPTGVVFVERACSKKRVLQRTNGAMAVVSTVVFRRPRHPEAPTAPSRAFA